MIKKSSIVVLSVAAMGFLALTGCVHEKPTAEKAMTPKSLLSVNSSKGVFTAGSGTLGSCPGNYTGKAIIKTATGSTWFTPDAGATNCTITDISGFGAPYGSMVESVENGTLRRACASNSVTFSVISSKKYNFTIYVVNTLPPPTNGENLTLQIQWQ